MSIYLGQQIESATAIIWQDQVMWYALAAIGLIGSAIFSGLETGIYRLNRIRLHLLAQRQIINASLLSRMVEKPNRILGTLLVGNNLMNYIASASLTALIQMAGFGQWGEVAITVGILTPIIFVFGEVIPKDLFANYTDRITYRFAKLLWVLQKLLLLTGVLQLIDMISHLLAKLLNAPQGVNQTLAPRSAMTMLFKESIGSGVLSHAQSDLIERVLHPTEQRVSDAMIPWSHVRKVTVTQSVNTVWRIAEQVPWNRLPLVEENGQVFGAINVYDVLLSSPKQNPPLTQFVKPLPKLTADLSLREALATLQKAQSPMGLVERHGRPIGIVTFKDLVEPITGELFNL